MGTRADFFVGRGEKAEWIGSIGWDGYPTGPACEVWRATTNEESFRRAVERMIESRDDGRHPRDGWPWPWETSRYTEWAYAFDAGRMWQSKFGGPWLPFGASCEQHEQHASSALRAPVVFPKQKPKRGRK